MTLTSDISSPLRDLWELDPATIYLNHGSFGPSPLPVQRARESWSKQLQRQPMRFFCHEMERQLDATTAVLAGFLQTKADRLVLTDNATFAMNVVAASVQLKSQDEVLLTDHEYGAVRNIWSQRCQQCGARVEVAALPFPPTPNEVVDAIAARITPRTRLLVVSHVTSATACILPVRQICELARQHRIPVCIDGPHALAMLDVRPEQIGCDYYCGSGHKWLCAPFGSGFLWVHPRHQSRIRSPIVSWGGSIAGHAASWKDGVNWHGTRDPAAMLSISAAIDFFTPECLQAFRDHSHQLLTYARRQLLTFPGVSEFCTPDEQDFVSMCGVELPQPAGWKPGYHGHPDPLQTELREQYGIEVPVASWNGHRYLRISAHLYNRREDLDALLNALQQCSNFT